MSNGGYGETPANGPYGAAGGQGQPGSGYGAQGGGYGPGAPGGPGGYGGGGPGGYGGPPPQNIPNYLVLSILATLISCATCCIPIGAVGLFFSTQVNSKLAAGDVAGAMAASKNAKLWSIIAIGVGIAAFVVGMIFGILGSVLSAVGGAAGR